MSQKRKQFDNGFLYNWLNKKKNLSNSNENEVLCNNNTTQSQLSITTEEVTSTTTPDISVITNISRRTSEDISGKITSKIHCKKNISFIRIQQQHHREMKHHITQWNKM
jgi:hypothetical protein